VYSSVRPYGPFWKYSWPNVQETYVSWSTGDVVLDTTRGSRIPEEMVEGLTRQVREIEATEGRPARRMTLPEPSAGEPSPFEYSMGNEVRLIQSSLPGGVSFRSKCVQIGQRHFLKVIIPFIPLTADLKNGHEESVN